MAEPMTEGSRSTVHVILLISLQLIVCLSMDALDFCKTVFPRLNVHDQTLDLKNYN